MITTRNHNLLAAALVSALTLLVAGPALAAATKPNIVHIVADDLGFADLGCYGGRPARFGAVSPVLDQLAASGIRFTQGYSNSPVCSPTRFALMTARYQYRLRGAAEEPINSKSRGSTTPSRAKGSFGIALRLRASSTNGTRTARKTSASKSVSRSGGVTR